MSIIELGNRKRGFMELIYEGKSKKVLKTEKENEILLYYKDDITAFNGLCSEQLKYKGVINNQISAILFGYLNHHHIATHYLKQLDDRSQRCVFTRIIPIEVIVRNYVAGSASQRFMIDEGVKLNRPIVEFCWKSDELNDPFINETHALAFNLATKEEMDEMIKMAYSINDLLVPLLKKAGIILADYKLEFGVERSGRILLVDEISPDTCRFWDQEEFYSMDKDRFRKQMTGVLDGYDEVLQRLKSVI